MTTEQIEAKFNEAEEHSKQSKFEIVERLCKEILDDLLHPNPFMREEGAVGEPSAFGGEHGVAALRSRTLYLYGESLIRQSKAMEALPIAEEALAAAEQSENKHDVAKALNLFGIVYHNKSDYLRALEYYEKSLEVGEELGIKASPAVTGNIGLLYAKMGDYSHALEYYAKALASHEDLGNKAASATVTGNIGNIYSEMGDYSLALEYFAKSLSIYEEFGNKAGAARIIANIGCMYHEIGQNSLALEYSARALAVQEELGNKLEVAGITNNLGNVYRTMGDFPRAMEYFTKALAAHEELGMTNVASIITGNIGLLYTDKKFDGYDPVKAEEMLLKALVMAEQVGAKKHLYEVYQTLAGFYDHTERKSEAYDYLLKFIELKDIVQSDEAKKKADQMELLKQIAVAKATADAKHQATEELLHNVLPPSIADKMLGGTKLIAEKIPSVSVLFADIVNFTKLSQRITPEELVDGLDRIFSAFDSLAEKYGLEKIKTIGDAYMVVSGAPVQREDHAEAMVNFAIEMLNAMKEFHSISTGEEIQLRIGIHSGEVVAGVIGKKKFAYDLWGDAVNTASRMESHGEAGKIHVSEEFMRALTAWTGHDLSLRDIQFVERGEMEIKGKGTMKTYFLEKVNQ